MGPKFFWRTSQLCDEALIQRTKKKASLQAVLNTVTEIRQGKKWINWPLIGCVASKNAVRTRGKQRPCGILEGGILSAVRNLHPSLQVQPAIPLLGRACNPPRPRSGEGHGRRQEAAKAVSGQKYMLEPLYRSKRITERQVLDIFKRFKFCHDSERGPRRQYSGAPQSHDSEGGVRIMTKI